MKRKEQQVASSSCSLNTHRVIPIEEYKFQKEKIGDYKLTHYIIYNDPLKTKHRKIKEPQNNINLI